MLPGPSLQRRAGRRSCTGAQRRSSGIRTPRASTSCFSVSCSARPERARAPCGSPTTPGASCSAPPGGASPGRPTPSSWRLTRTRAPSSPRGGPGWSTAPACGSRWRRAGRGWHSPSSGMRRRASRPRRWSPPRRSPPSERQPCSRPGASARCSASPSGTRSRRPTTSPTSRTSRPRRWTRPGATDAGSRSSASRWRAYRTCGRAPEPSRRGRWCVPPPGRWGGCSANRTCWRRWRSRSFCSCSRRPTPSVRRSSSAGRWPRPARPPSSPPWTAARRSS